MLLDYIFDDNMTELKQIREQAVREFAKRIGLDDLCIWKDVAIHQHKQDEELMPLCYNCNGYNVECGYYFEKWRVVRGR